MIVWDNGWGFSEATTGGVLQEMVFLEISQNPQENMCHSLFLIRLQAGACNIFKIETPAQVFSCKLWEISKNTFSAEHFGATAPHVLLKVYHLPKPDLSELIEFFGGEFSDTTLNLTSQ